MKKPQKMKVIKKKTEKVYTSDERAKIEEEKHRKEYNSK